MKSIIITTGLPGLLACLWSYLRRGRKIQFILLLGLMLLSACLEVVSLGAVIPFLGILAAPEKVFNYPVVSKLTQYFGIISSEQLVLPLTIAFIVAVLSAGIIRIIVLWASVRIAFGSGAEISIEAYRRTLYQPYVVHISRNSSEIISGISGKVSGAVNLLYQVLVLISSCIFLVTITIALFAINPLIAASVAIVLGLIYGFIGTLARRRLRKNSQLIAFGQTQVIKALQEGLGSIRDILLDGAQGIYCDVYSQAEKSLKHALGNNDFIGASPRYVMEMLGMIVIAVLAYGLSLKDGGFVSALPMLGALALGAQRLLPVMQQAFGAWASISGNYSALVDTVKLLQQPAPDDMSNTIIEPMLFSKSIQFDSVRFRYSNEQPWVLNDLNLRIPKGARVGFVGSTGSGKSTTLDLLMGLLEPTEGRLLVDDVSINSDNVRALQQIIAHVPQSIYLADCTLAENIAFGVPFDEIDIERVKLAARQAQIAEFIENGENGYNDLVGEYGIRLSGGQRQRIGIARALYKQASILIFDEATSALDVTTEKLVMESIEGLHKDFTIILIAHRLSTVRHCDIIYELEHGRVVSQGTYDELCETSSSFRKMAQSAI